MFDSHAEYQAAAMLFLYFVSGAHTLLNIPYVQLAQVGNLAEFGDSSYSLTLRLSVLKLNPKVSNRDLCALHPFLFIAVADAFVCTRST